MRSPTIHEADPGTGSVRVDLAWPIEQGDGATREHVTLRRIRGGDLRATANLGAMEQGLKLIERCGGLLPADVDRLDGVDLDALSEVVAGFSAGGRAHGSET